MSTSSVLAEGEPPVTSENVPENKAEKPSGPEFVYIKSETGDSEHIVSVKIEQFDNSAPSYGETPFGAAYPIGVNVKTEPLDDYVGVKIDHNIFDIQPHTSHSIFSSDQPQQQTKQQHPCPICNKQFASPSNVQRHLTIHTRTKMACHVCHKQYVSDELLYKHIQNKHTEPRRHACPQCGKLFKSTSNLQQHSRMHLAEKPFKCDRCTRTFSVKSNLLRHQSKTRCKRPTEKQLTCHVCNKEFVKEFLLKSHLRRHDTEKPFYCDHCKMNFKYKSTLIRHIQVHNGFKPYSCTLCDKTFTHSGLIKPHMRTHTGEKPYKCTFCTKYFAHKHNMQRHAMRHSIIKNLVCDVCHKKFPKESRLRYHMKIHVDQKHFSCHVCPKKFSHRQNILRHYTRKHPGEVYQCKDTDASVASRVWEAVVQNKLLLKGYESPEEILGYV